MLRYAEELIALASEHGFPLWLAYGIMFRGFSLTAPGRVEEGLKLLNEALAAFRATGAVLSVPYMLTLIAESCGKLARPAEGLDFLAKATQIVETTEERRDEAEIHRVRGDLLTATGGRAAAEQSYRQALAVATRQSAKVFELRAAVGLARLWCGQGNRPEARDLLVPIYGWFTEGFDTPDLKEAKALLEALG